MYAWYTRVVHSTMYLGNIDPPELGRNVSLGSLFRPRRLRF